MLSANEQLDWPSDRIGPPIWPNKCASECVRQVRVFPPSPLDWPTRLTGLTSASSHFTHCKHRFALPTGTVRPIAPPCGRTMPVNGQQFARPRGQRCKERISALIRMRASPAGAPALADSKPSRFGLLETPAGERQSNKFWLELRSCARREIVEGWAVQIYGRSTVITLLPEQPHTGAGLRLPDSEKPRANRRNLTETRNRTHELKRVAESSLNKRKSGVGSNYSPGASILT